jgi:hypothetical protein
VSSRTSTTIAGGVDMIHMSTLAVPLVDSEIVTVLPTEIASLKLATDASYKAYTTRICSIYSSRWILLSS